MGGWGPAFEGPQALLDAIEPLEAGDRLEPGVVGERWRTGDDSAGVDDVVGDTGLTADADAGRDAHVWVHAALTSEGASVTDGDVPGDAGLGDAAMDATAELNHVGPELLGVQAQRHGRAEGRAVRPGQPQNRILRVEKPVHMGGDVGEHGIQV
jgi:hypothetical protein